MATQEDKLKDIIGHAKEYGFVFPSSEIYDGLSATYDYGQLGAELKNNIKNYWWKAMVHMNENIVGLDAAIFMAPDTWKASGHVDAFNDPLIDNKDSKKRYRADVLIEDYIEKIRAKINKDVAKGLKRFGDDFNEEEFRTTNPNVLRRVNEIKGIEDRMRDALENEKLDDLKKLIEDLEIACPLSGSKNWTDVKQFNLMEKVEVGVGEAIKILYNRDNLLNSKSEYLSNCLTRLKVPEEDWEKNKRERSEMEEERLENEKLEQFKKNKSQKQKEQQQQKEPQLNPSGEPLGTSEEKTESKRGIHKPKPKPAILLELNISKWWRWVERTKSPPRPKSKPVKAKAKPNNKGMNISWWSIWWMRMERDAKSEVQSRSMSIKMYLSHRPKSVLENVLMFEDISKGDQKGKYYGTQLPCDDFADSDRKKRHFGDGTSSPAKRRKYSNITPHALYLNNLVTKLSNRTSHSQNICEWKTESDS